VAHNKDGSLLVTGATPARIGDLAQGAGIALHELSPVQASLEEVFMELTSEAVDYHGSTSSGVTR
jgi:ABC-2 type transport system ATP-binding protein